MTTHSNSTHASSYRICRPRTEPIVSASRMRCVCSASAPSTAWRRRSWQRPSTSWMWTRRSSRPACSTRSLQAMSAAPSYRPFWSTRSRTRSGLEEAAALGGRGWVWSEPVPTSPTHPHPPVRCPTSSFSLFFLLLCLFSWFPRFSGFVSFHQSRLCFFFMLTYFCFYTVNVTLWVYFSRLT